MKIIKKFLTPNKYSRPQTPLKKVTKIAVHYIGNPNTSALANRNYFNNLANTHTTYASSHYIIGLDGEIIQCIPENEIAYCTNQANSYSISIENCHPKADGKFTDETLKSLIELCADLCKRYNLNPQKDIIRHFDVTGKQCPLYWVNHPMEFLNFKNDVADKIKEEEIDVEELKKLQTENFELKKRVEKLENSQEKVYNTLEEVPQWGRTVVHDLIDKGYIKGTDKGLNITDTLLRMLVITDRAGLYKD